MKKNVILTTIEKTDEKPYEIFMKNIVLLNLVWNMTRFNEIHP